MTRDQNQPSEWAREKAKTAHDELCRNAFVRISAGKLIDDEYKHGCVDIIAHALDSAVAERDEAIRVLAARVHSCEYMLACYRTSRRPSEIALDRAMMTDGDLNANPIARAAVDAAKEKA